jgi:phospholipid/cholesterol/gamma-HCH transport system substrate-binding protein
MKVGAAVRYRGVVVGKITEIKAGTNGVNTTVEISPANLLIPRNVLIEANQAGLIGETAIDITPLKDLPKNALSINPLSSQCNSQIVICHQDRLNGQIGVSFDELLRNTIRLSSVYSDPAFFNNVNALTKNASIAATGVAQLTAELSLLTRSTRQQLGGFSTASNSITRAANQTVNQVGFAARRFGNTADQLSDTAQKFGDTAQQASLTAAQLTQLAASTNNLLVANKSSLGATLNNFREASDQLRLSVSTLTPLLNQVGKGDLLRNLETISANAAQLSANLRDISTSLNNPQNALLLQQTLESARATFENTQKITSDLDELTGDPAFRNNLKQLVNGLGNLVSSTQQLQQQVQVVQQLEPLSTALNQSVSRATERPRSTPQSQLNPDPGVSSTQVNLLQAFPPLFPSVPKKPSPGITSQPLSEPLSDTESDRQKD